MQHLNVYSEYLLSSMNGVIGKKINKPVLNGQLKPRSTFEWKTGGAKFTQHSMQLNPLVSLAGQETFGMFAIHNEKITATRYRDTNINS